MSPSHSEFDIPVLFEDEYLLAVNKPAGLIVHANPVSENHVRRPEADLESLVQDRYGKKRALVLFHRLDKDTSGVVLFGKRRETNALVSEAFANKRIRKAYFAVVRGDWDAKHSRIESWLKRQDDGRRMLNVAQSAGGKPAITSFRVLARGAGKTWLEAMPKTGRTHQIRVHCQLAGCPIMGDRLYDDQALSTDPPQALHAHRLDLRHPVSGQDLRIDADLPASFYNHWLIGIDPAKHTKTRGAR